jgi:hypothetical protein
MLASRWTIRQFAAQALLLAAMLCIGCQSGPIFDSQLAATQSELTRNGLDSAQALPLVRATGATPSEWVKRPIENGAIYTHQQWLSPTGTTGVGVVYVHLPLPIGPTAILWLAEQHFAAMPGQKGHIVGEWIDPLGRNWFTAVNPQTNVCGYILTEGAAAWIVYFGYKLDRGFHPAEMSVAARSVTTIIPLTHANEQSTGSKVAETPLENKPE